MVNMASSMDCGHVHAMVKKNEVALVTWRVYTRCKCNTKSCSLGLQGTSLILDIHVMVAVAVAAAAAAVVVNFVSVSGFSST